MREPIRVYNVEKDREKITAELNRYIAAGRRRPRLEFRGPCSAMIVDEWETVPSNVWARWASEFG